MHFATRDRGSARLGAFEAGAPVAPSNARVCSVVAIIWIKCATTSAVRRPRLESFLYLSAARKGGNNLLRRNNKCVVDGGLVPLVSPSLSLSLSLSFFLSVLLVHHTSFTPRVRVRARAAYRTVHTRVFSVSPRFMSLDGRADLEDRSFVCPLSRVPRCRAFCPPSSARLLRPGKYLGSDRPWLATPSADALSRELSRYFSLGLGICNYVLRWKREAQWVKVG